MGQESINADTFVERPRYHVSDQIAKEREHEIQYRTCSWQKVWPHCPLLGLICAMFHRPLGSCFPNMSALPSWPSLGARCPYRCETILKCARSYSILGLVPGVLVTVAVAITVQYTCETASESRIFQLISPTALIVWRFCMENPEVTNVCDIGRIICGGSEWGYNVTVVGFILNNTFIQGSLFLAVEFESQIFTALECLVGAKLLNTLSHSGVCTVGFR